MWKLNMEFSTFLTLGNNWSWVFLRWKCEHNRWLFQLFLVQRSTLLSSRIQERLWRPHRRHKGHTSRSLNHIPLRGIFWGTNLMPASLRCVAIRICSSSRLFRSSCNCLFWFESLGMRPRTSSILHHHWHRHRVGFWQISNLQTPL